jgi:RimJ/RimL family protein N-acetyltransferase
MDLRFPAIVSSEDLERAVELLVADEWPYHVEPRPTAAVARRLVTPDAAQRSHLLVDGSLADDPGGGVVGVVRLIDLDDIPDGAPLFDLRIATTRRGRGYGRAAVDWLTEHLFSLDPGLHRIEATTRADNVAMRTVLEWCGWTLEGRFREAWPGPAGGRYDALAYGVLRTDRRGRSDRPIDPMTCR